MRYVFILIAFKHTIISSESL